MDKRVISDPDTHYGSPKAATRHFIVQRVTGAANVLFLLFLIWFVVSLAGADRAQLAVTIRNPLVALMLVLLIVNVAVHMRIGIKEVIEDYVHDPRLKSLSLMLTSVFAIAIGAIVIVAVAVLAFGA